MASFKVLSWYLSGGTEEDHENLWIAGLWAEISAEGSAIYEGGILTSRP
jgi:hypothetical protein